MTNSGSNGNGKKHLWKPSSPKPQSLELWYFVCCIT